jgi:hypothetical protein
MGIEMALLDYQKLCPKSGHVLSNEEHAALRGRRPANAGPLCVQCETCGRLVEVCAGPGQARSLIYRMHVRDVCDLGSAAGAAQR